MKYQPEWLTGGSEASRSRREQWFQSLFEFAPYAIVVVDRGGHIVVINDEAEKIFGYTQKELAGNPVEILLPGRFRDVHAEHRAGYHANPYRRPMGEGLELFARRKNGDEFPVDIVLSPVETGENDLVVSIVIDITERKEAEERLKRQAEELRRSNEDLEQFAWVASHDLQEPLRKVRIFSELLGEDCGEGFSGEGRDYLQRIREAGERMQNLIDKLLSYSRAANGGERTQVDLGEVARGVLSDLEVQIRQTGGRVELNNLPTLKADPVQMRQLLQNLIGNALKFCRQGTPPVVSLSGKRQDDETRPPMWEIVVEDNGVGFEEEMGERIFGLFQRLHGRSEYDGSGIGLAICRKIVERHGGAIRAEGKPGQGAKVTVLLPV